MVDLDSTLAAEAEAETTPPRHAEVIRRGDQIGRYLVLARIGAGGMGEVFAAYDPELDRKLALKLLHGDRPGARSTAGRSRLLREAQALARLSHPNTVTVHDVGEHDGRVFLAMEFVAGRTLGEWLAAERRDWRTIVPVFAAAGRGLAAAHAAGLIHRDFKPDNVMVGDDGRVKVMDFGLARATEDLAEPSMATRLGLDSSSGISDIRAKLDEVDRASMSAALTHHGSLTGTPAYMAPEQFMAQPTDARTDQFAFCVALYEALYGERPFAGETPAALAFSVLQGQRREVPEADVPSWLRRALERGLATDPDQRWPSLAELLAELERDRKRRWQRLGLLVGGVALLTVAALPWLRSDDADARVCTGAEAAIVEVWGPDRRSAAQAAVRATGLAHAEATWDRVAPILDDWSARWIAARTEACEATELRREQSAELMQLRMRCLDRQRRVFAVLVDDLVAADAEVLEGAVAASQRLPAIERCADFEYVSAQIPPPEDPARARAVEELREQLAASERLRRVAPAERRAEVEGLRAAASALEHPPVLAEAELRLGRLYAEQARGREALASLRAAYFAARGLGLDEVAMNAATELIYVTGELLADHDAAFEWAEHAAAEVRRGGTDEDEARRLDRLAQVRMARGDNATAEAELRRALELHRAAVGEDDAETAAIRLTLADLLQDLDRNDEARAEFERAGALIEAELGDRHPRLGLVWLGFAQLDIENEELDRGLARTDEALALWSETLPDDHPWLADLHNDRGLLFNNKHEFEAARASLEQALDIRRRRLGPEHPSVAATLTNLGTIVRSLGDRERSLELLQEAEALMAKTGTLESVAAAYLCVNLTNSLLAVGRIAEAEAKAEACEPRAIAALGDEHPIVFNIRILHAMLASARRDWATVQRLMLGNLEQLERRGGEFDEPWFLTLLVLADAEANLGLAEQALAHVERTLAADYDPIDDNLVAVARVRAMALWQLGRRREARELADATLERFADHGSELSEFAELANWRREHR